MSRTFTSLCDDAGAARTSDHLISLRSPRSTDAAAVRRLAAEGGALEPISCYGYLLLCTHFASTSLVAERDGELMGFVLAYRPPEEPETVFVWQIGVHQEARGLGLGRRLLSALFDQSGCRSARFLTATVSPDNQASLSLFKSFARQQQTVCEVSTGFPAALFDAPHPDENLLRIGPLKGQA